MKSTNLQPARMMNSMPGRQSGLSLIELMIASVIGLVLLSGVVTIFSSNSASSKMSTGMTRIQDSGRVALDMLSYNLRMTGYEGCRDGSKDQIQVLASNPPTINFPDNTIWGSSVSNTGGFVSTAHPDLTDLPDDVTLKANTDVLYLQHGSGRSVNLATDMATSNAAVVLPRNPDQISAGDLVMISDCDSANIFRATGVTVDATSGNTTIQHDTTGNTQGNLTQAFWGTGNLNSVAVRVMRFESKAYFIADSNRDMPDDSPIWSLFELDTSNGGNPTELIEGVEDFQIRYGVQPSQNTTADIRYVTADAVTDPSQIVSVQLGLLIGTSDYLATTNDTQNYNLASWSVGPPNDTGADANHAGDRRIRASFNTTVQLRNRQL